MSYTPGPLPEPNMQTDPCNSNGAQTSYYSADAVNSYTAAEVARAVAAEVARFRKEYETELARLRLQSNAAVGFKPNSGPGPWFTWW